MSYLVVCPASSPFQSRRPVSLRACASYNEALDLRDLFEDVHGEPAAIIRNPDLDDFEEAPETAPVTTDPMERWFDRHLEPLEPQEVPAAG
jgi:hypothetical protein